MAIGFFIALKLAGTTHGFGWATKVAVNNKTATLVKNSLIVFINKCY
jgi:hypothetical protein